MLNKLASTTSSFQFSIQTIFDTGFVALPYKVPPDIALNSWQSVLYKQGFPWSRITGFNPNKNDFDTKKSLPLFYTHWMPLLDQPIFKMEPELELPTQVARLLDTHAPMFPKNRLAGKLAQAISSPTPKPSARGEVKTDDHSGFTEYIFTHHWNDPRPDAIRNEPEPLESFEGVTQKQLERLWQHDRIRGPMIEVGVPAFSERTRQYALFNHAHFAYCLPRLLAWVRDADAQNPVAQADRKEATRDPRRAAEQQRKQKHGGRAVATSSFFPPPPRGRPRNNVSEDLLEVDASLRQQAQEQAQRRIQEAEDMPEDGLQARTDSKSNYVVVRVRAKTNGDNPLYDMPHPHALLRQWRKYAVPRDLEPENAYIVDDARFENAFRVPGVTAAIKLFHQAIFTGGRDPGAHTDFGWHPQLQRWHGPISLDRVVPDIWYGYGYFRLLYAMERGELGPDVHESALWLAIFRGVQQDSLQFSDRVSKWPEAPEVGDFIARVLCGINVLLQTQEHWLGIVLAEIPCTDNQLPQFPALTDTDITAMIASGINVSSGASRPMEASTERKKVFYTCAAFVRQHMLSPVYNHAEFLQAAEKLLRHLSDDSRAAVWFHQTCLEARWDIDGAEL
jgi:hypothetical protein